MTLHELLEAAQLDALGLLDAEEQQAFEKAFVAAAPAVRDGAAREQARLCRLESVLPDVAPPADLRQRVLNAVSTAQATETLSELRESRTLHGAGRQVGAGRSEGRVSRLWRAAAVGFAAASVVFGFTTIYVRNQHQSLTTMIEDQRTMNALVNALGTDHVSSAIFDPNTKRVIFASKDPAFRGKASLWINADWEQARFFAMNLPSDNGSSYKLVACDRAGSVTHEIAEFDAGAGMFAKNVTVNPAKDYTLALVRVAKGGKVSDGTTVLQPAPISTALAMVFSTGEQDQA